MAKILIVDDEKGLRKMLGSQMVRLGHDAIAVSTLADGINSATNTPFDLIFLDVQMPDGNGLDFLPQFKAVPSSPEVIIITGEGDPDGAEKAVKSGAWGYIEKPHVIKDLALQLERALQFRQEKNRVEMVPVALKRENIIGNSSPLRHCLDQLAKAAVGDVSVLITGETGTGKEVFARAIHENSSRASGNFVVVDCASLPETLIESILFGHVKGAFTGADRQMDGLVSQADGGTLFLDEIGELPLQIQKSFLRVLQERSFRPVGASHELSSDFRLVAATNRNLEERIKEGSFRKDLLFRLQAFTINLPPLRQRLDDLKELTTYFIGKFCEQYDLECKGFGQDFVSTLAAHDWPGNVRELSQTLEQSFTDAFHSPTLFPNHLPVGLRIQQARNAVKGKTPSASQVAPTTSQTLRQAKDIFEKEYLGKVLLQTDGNISATSRIAGLSRTQTYRLLSKHKLID